MLAIVNSLSIMTEILSAGVKRFLGLVAQRRGKAEGTEIECRCEKGIGECTGAAMQRGLGFRSNRRRLGLAEKQSRCTVRLALGWFAINI